MRRTRHTWRAAILIYSLFLVVPPSTIAVDNGVLPFSFSSGTPAKASEVNQNFQYVNYGNLVVIDGTGAVLGTYMWHQLSHMAYLNNSGYVVGLEFPITRPAPYDVYNIKVSEISIFYLTQNCTGNAYIDTRSEGFYTSIPGTMFSNNGNLFYTPKNQTLLNDMIIMQDPYVKSTSAQPGCSQFAGTIEAYPILPNNISVTGEYSVTKTPPLRIIRRIP